MYNFNLSKVYRFFGENCRLLAIDKNFNKVVFAFSYTIKIFSKNRENY